MTTEELEIVDALRRYAKTQEAEAAQKSPLPPNSTRDLMARIRREEARQGAKKSRWLVTLQCLTVSAVTAIVFGVLMAYVSGKARLRAVMKDATEQLSGRVGSFAVQFEMASPQGIKGESPRAQDFYLDAAPTLSVDWDRQTFSIPLRAGGMISGTITPKTEAPGGAAREFDITASGTSKGESITATGQIVVMPNKPDVAPEFLQAKDVDWLKLNLTIRGNAREEQVYRVFGSP